MSVRSRIFGIAGVALLTATAAAAGETKNAMDVAFDSSAWKAEAGNRKGQNPRGGMADDAEKALSPNMSRAEVEALLGRPDERWRLFIYGAPASGKRLHDKAVRFGVDGKVPENENNIAKDLSGAGMTQRQVAAVIGEPTAVRDDLIYNLGSSEFGLDPVYLHVEFDERGVLIRHFREQG